MGLRTRLDFGTVEGEGDVVVGKANTFAGLLTPRIGSVGKPTTRWICGLVVGDGEGEGEGATIAAGFAC